MSYLLLPRFLVFIYPERIFGMHIFDEPFHGIGW
jgi:hypothetical protein